MESYIERLQDIQAELNQEKATYKNNLNKHRITVAINRISVAIAELLNVEGEEDA